LLVIRPILVDLVDHDFQINIAVLFWPSEHFADESLDAVSTYSLVENFIFNDYGGIRRFTANIIFQNKKKIEERTRNLKSRPRYHLMNMELYGNLSNP